MTKYKISEELLKEVVAISFSKKETLIRLGMTVSGGAYKSLTRKINKYSIDTSHFDKTTNNVYTWDEILVENSSYTNPSSIKRYLVDEGIFVYQCSFEDCPTRNLGKWRNNDLTLHLDHINGVNNDHRIENLRLLCPNCHSQTDTWCKGTKRKKPARRCRCGREISKNAILCVTCNNKQNNNSKNRFKIEWPSKEEIKYRLESTTFVQLGRELGVSDNAIRKYLNRDI